MTLNAEAPAPAGPRSGAVHWYARTSEDAVAALDAARQFGWALLPAVALLVVWEFGNYLARRRAPAPSVRSAVPAGG